MQQKREKFKKDTGLSLERLSDWEKHRYNMAKGGQVDETEVHGNPNLIYSSKFVEGWEPSGVPVSSIPHGIRACDYLSSSTFTDLFYSA